MIPPLVEEKLRRFAERHAALEQLLADPSSLENGSLYASRSRELGILGKRVARYSEYSKVVHELADNEELAKEGDPELRQLAREEILRLQGRAGELEEELVGMVLDEDKDASRNVIMEIRAGTGGDEAALWAADLLRMYTKYAGRRGWKTELIDASPSELGGFKEVIVSITGDSVHRDLRYEMGGHRVQRVPITEASGRIQTSMATVAVLGEAEEVDIEIKESDIKMDFYRSSGPGGQNVNKTSSAVRLTHIPTGLVVAIQEESSQHKNRAKAMRVLRSRLYDLHEAERKEKEQDIRRNQIGSGDRNQRVRTYNFPQSRVTDHRINENFNLERIVIEGDLAPLIESLRAYDRDLKLKAL